MGSMTVPKGIGVEIRIKRARNGLSQGEASKVIGTNQSYLSQIERGRIVPTEEEMRAIKVFLKMSEGAIREYLAAI